jgi:hypothetical protein
VANYGSAGGYAAGATWQPRRPQGVREHLARFLRRLANRLEPRTPIRLDWGPGMENIAASYEYARARYGKPHE